MDQLGCFDVFRKGTFGSQKSHVRNLNARRVHAKCGIKYKKSVCVRGHRNTLPSNTRGPPPNTSANSVRTGVNKWLRRWFRFIDLFTGESSVFLFLFFTLVIDGPTNRFGNNVLRYIFKYILWLSRRFYFEMQKNNFYKNFFFLFFKCARYIFFWVLCFKIYCCWKIFF